LAFDGDMRRQHCCAAIAWGVAFFSLPRCPGMTSVENGQILSDGFLSQACSIGTCRTEYDQLTPISVISGLSELT
jgi:hypothetical protein